MGGFVQAITAPVTKAVTSLLGVSTNIPKIELPPAPAVEPPKPMPTPNDADVRTAKRRSIAEQTQRRGRASTILTAEAGDTLG